MNNPNSGINCINFGYFDRCVSMLPRRVGQLSSRIFKNYGNPVILSLLLGACQAVPTTKVVQVPLPLPAPQPGLIEKPYLPILDVPLETIEACENTGDLCGDLVKALDASLEAAMAWGLQQEIVLDGYRKSVIK